MRVSTLFISIILFSLCSISPAQEQTSKGVYRLSGNVGFSYKSENYREWNHKSFNLSISPGYSLFAADNFELGLQLSYSYHYGTISYFDPYPNREDTHQSYDLSISPAVRYYFPMEKLLPFIGAKISFSSNLHMPFIKSFITGLASLSCGMDFFISKNIALEPTLNYDFHFYKDGQSFNEISLGAGINYFIF